MRVLVTGGAGYISYDLINQLHRRDDVSQIIIFDNLAYSSLNFLFGEFRPKLEFIKGDVLDTPRLEAVLKRVDAVYHLAAYVQDAYNYMQSLHYHQVNQWGTLSLTRAIERCPGVKTVIYVSSTAVYGFKEELTENQEPAPANAYAESKYLGEQYIKGISDRCRVHIVRLANVYGYNPCFRRDSVINSFVMDALVNKKVLIYGSGKQKRAFVSITKAADHLSILLNSGYTSEAQVVFDFSASVNEIHEVIARQLPELEYTYINQDSRFESQSFHDSELTEQHEADIVKTLNDFKRNLRILKN